MRPKISICIPAYNRPAELADMLESVARQGPGDWDVVVCEDHSPRRAEIQATVAGFKSNHPELSVNYFANEQNLGYDGNLRSLLDRATGNYCLFMGDDDVLSPGALPRMVAAVSRPEGIGFVLRAWESVDKETGSRIEMHRYFEDDRLFSPGIGTVAAMFRRAVFISGLAVNREAARAFHTTRFDGSLLYQLYLVGRLSMSMPAYYVSDVVAVRRIGGQHFFGSSDAEKDKFRPGELVASQSISFIKGFLRIARHLDEEGGCPGVRQKITRDLGRYSYPVLEIQACRLRRREFRVYASQLARLGLGDCLHFRAYYAALLLLGPTICNAGIRTLKRILGRTPDLSGAGGRVVR